MVQGKFFGSPHFDAPVEMKRCGTFFWLTYLWIAVLPGVPSVWNSSSTFSCSTSWRTTSTVLGGEYASSSVTKLTLRPLMPPASFNALKNA